MPTDLPEGVSSELNWIVPPIFLESERRFMKYFTIGSEIQFSRMGIDTEIYGASSKFRSTSLGLELQGKVSIPIFNIFEAYGQYGLGYSHYFINTTTTGGDTNIEQDFGIGYITHSMSLGASIIFAESFGFFIEAGVMKGKSVKTVGEIYDDAVSTYGSAPASDVLGSMANDHASGKSPFVKIGVVFQIETN